MPIILIYTMLTLLKMGIGKIWPHDCYVGNELSPTLVNALTVRTYILSVFTLHYL